MRLWERDALGVEPSDFARLPLGIIVGNPPFEHGPGGEQTANRFLAKTLDLLAQEVGWAWLCPVPS